MKIGWWAALMLLWFQWVQGQEVRIAVGEWPPYVGAELPRQGFLCELVKEAFHEVGIEASFHFFPWQRAYKLTLAGEFEATMPWFRSAQREQAFYYSLPLGHFTTRLFALADRPLPGLRSLQGYKVGGTRGYYYGEMFASLQNELEMEWSMSDEQTLGKLLLGRTDVMVMDEQVVLALLKEKGIPRTRLHSHSEPVWSEEGVLLIPRRLPNADALVNKLNVGLGRLHDSGRFTRYWQPQP
ncbi:amino acid ABC transporter substrate-binding protein [Aeromonas schubertii]|uniref:substrate-binding periplasmic protein n=1 Tax=Aeromonas schubertii TaxID=652 RepID=UPI00067E9FB7|nr:transporter substrate-binding domain-containing protein [Aeromonas schubertii]KUE78472.1 amino acid ABC transporter substrate-binding protein [Aeromonas schubertii]